MRGLLLAIVATLTLPLWLAGLCWQCGAVAWAGGRMHGQRFTSWLVRD